MLTKLRSCKSLCDKLFQINLCWSKRVNKILWCSQILQWLKQWLSARLQYPQSRFLMHWRYCSLARSPQIEPLLAPVEQHLIDIQDLEPWSADCIFIKGTQTWSSLTVLGHQQVQCGNDWSVRQGFFQILLAFDNSKTHLRSSDIIQNGHWNPAKSHRTWSVDL